MCCFEEALQNCTGMMDPYGDMPLAGGMTASAEIDIMDTENGVHVSVVKTPPRNGKIRLSKVIESIMESYMASPCAADQGERKGKDCLDEPCEDGKMKSPSSPSSKGQGSQPWGEEKSEGSSDASDRQGDEGEGRKQKQTS